MPPTATIPRTEAPVCANRPDDGCPGLSVEGLGTGLVVVPGVLEVEVIGRSRVGVGVGVGRGSGISVGGGTSPPPSSVLAFTLSS